jgi:glutaryl-CoA dehydrogenase
MPTTQTKQFTKKEDFHQASREDRYQHHDYYLLDELLSEDHLLAREAVRDWVKQEVSPIIEDYSNRAACPTHLFKGLAEIGAFGPEFAGRIRRRRNG